MATLPIISKAIVVLFLTSWTLTALSFTALDALNSDQSLISLIVPTSLLTFLVCRLFIASQPSDGAGAGSPTVAQTITSAHRHSPRNALILLLFTLSWLYELLFKCFGMFIVTLVGGFFFTAIHNDALVAKNGTGVSELESTAMAGMADFQDKTGVDPTQIIKAIPPRALLYWVLLVWVNLATLGLYILRLAWKSLRMVLGGPIAAPAVADEKKVE
ncbi:uncharacterized protein BO95DRAFT_441039 [Aspergillus brunneoviolaceus CBS 621.78]|uniref:Uncharacterized protein n=1 Tax=Aspergillus brunneoviolaceus CBS 621.78 TaxID=1450534 RepID=A0ACD1GEZ7_9EURO|nr:hypothetical protein BO95DRAFT_441039 [Aspergillus brunneoviolaceus CBS 621.78]RAH47792.1 hypothetical protein BO95DRAFT_441039 [Aspergillus brunneoviolaceus CBS 621.78]